MLRDLGVFGGLNVVKISVYGFFLCVFLDTADLPVSSLLGFPSTIRVYAKDFFVHLQI